MMLILRKILSLDERLAFSLIGIIRHYVLFPFNWFPKKEVQTVNKKLKADTPLIKEQLLKLLPTVNGEEIKETLCVDELKNIIINADKILAGEFEIFSTKVNYKNGIDWHLDFKSGYRWPKGKLYNKYIQVDVNTNADVKYPRELSRCHHFLHLGQAYLITNDEKYTQEFIDQIEHWIEQNPYKKSINWGCSMDIAIRASNWIFALKMFIYSPLVNDDFLHRINTSIFLHGRYIFEHPEKNRVYNHNHYLSDLSGQILIALYFKVTDNKEVSLWKEKGIYELYREIRVQILPTGFTYERTTNYHRLVTELITYTIIILKNNNEEIPLDIFYRIKKMIEVIMYYHLKSDYAPAIGDQDNGRYLPFFSYDINYHKYLLNIGSVLFKDERFKKYSGISNIDVLFLFGKQGIVTYNNLEAKDDSLESKAFPDVGFYIMRTANVYIFINNSGLSHYNEVAGGTHTHSDLLSFVYAINDVPFLIDPGTYIYSSEPEERLKFRSTFMHNTATIDNFDQNNLEKNNLWAISRDAIPKEIQWHSDKTEDLFKGSHNGYQRLKDPVTHVRSFNLVKSKNYLRIIDQLEVGDNHNIKLHFHFDNNVALNIVEKVIYCKNSNEYIKINFKSNLSYTIEQKEEYISKSYGHKCLAPYVIINFDIEKSNHFTTIIEKSNSYEANF